MRCFHAGFGFAHRLLRFRFKAAELLARLALNFVDEGGGGGFCGFTEERAGALESVADDFLHLVLRVADEIAAGSIELAGKHRGDFAGAFAQARFGLLSGAFRKMLNLCLRFFLVPLRGFQ